MLCAVQAGLKGDYKCFNVTSSIGEVTRVLGDIELAWKEHWAPVHARRARDRREREQDKRMRQMERQRAQTRKDRALGLVPHKTTVTYLPEDPAAVVPIPDRLAAAFALDVPPARAQSGHESAPLRPDLSRRGLVRKSIGELSCAANRVPALAQRR